jgi:transcriptional regulator with XRE-family HTH domain
MSVAERVLSALKSEGVSQAKLADLTGIPRVALNKSLKGKRGFKPHELAKIAQALKLTSNDIGIPTDRYGSVPSAKVARYVRIKGEVAAGAWREVSYLTDFAEFDYPVLADPKWPEGAVSGLIVRGKSMNRQARDGDIAVVLAYEHAPRKFREGDFVVVRRERYETFEMTVKLVKGDEVSGWELWPDSDDPQHQAPIKIDGPGVEQVEVIGFVLDFVRQATHL